MDMIRVYVCIALVLSGLGCQPGTQSDETTLAGTLTDPDANVYLEFRLIDAERDAYLVMENSDIPLDSELILRRDGSPVLVFRETIVSSEHITEVTSEAEGGEAAVAVKLNDEGAQRMLAITEANLLRPMAAVVTYEEGNTKRVTVVNTATIRAPFSDRFHISGLTAAEAERLVSTLQAASGE